MDHGSYDILKKELLYHGINVIGNNVIEVGNVKKNLDKYLFIDLEKDMSHNVDILKMLWREVVDILFAREKYPNVSSNSEVELFIFSLKDMARFLEMFESLDKSSLKICLQKALNCDIIEYNYKQISAIPDYKISIDWIFRVTDRLCYIKNMLKSLKNANRKLASGASGPWSNLDLPMLERVFSWDDVDAETRGKDRDIRRQQRYRKGFESYNNDGSVGEGHYWRELKNECFSWYDRKDEDPYYQRYVLDGR